MSEFWLIEQATLESMQSAMARGVDSAQLAQFEASAADPQSRILSVAGKVAQINVQGVLTDKPNYFARYWGGGNTTYGEITQALAEAERDIDVKEAVMVIQSGGGQASDALFDTLAAIETFSKPITARIKGVGASAAYALASQADKIEATNAATRVGSIGVVIQFAVSDDIVTITSSKSPNKAPDVRTEEGKAAVRAELDDTHAIFVDAIAKGRKTTIDKVDAEFGQGSVLLAGEAKTRRMIDAIVGSIPETGNKSETKNNKMTLAELQVQHPEAYQAAVSEGANLERKRVTDHLKVGQASGAVDIAVKAISEGTPFADLQADYMAAQFKKTETKDRQDDANDANAAIDGAAKDKEVQQDQGDLTFAAFSGTSNHYVHNG